MKLNPPTLTAEAFFRRWQDADWGERASYQEHFRSVCQLVGALTPSEYGEPENYTFEYGLKKTNGHQGYGDVFCRGHFAIEYKKKGEDLNKATIQLQQYRENMDNPPLLIVCDIEHWEIRTNFTNTPTTLIQFRHEDILKVETRSKLRRIFSDPNSFHPEKNKEEITREVAARFKDVVDGAIGYQNDPERVARFMTRLVFCMFVEDIGLLPKRAFDGILTEIIRTTRMQRDLFPRYVLELFEAMATGGNVQMVTIPWFNGSMFEVGESDVVPLSGAALNALDQASSHDWAHVEPSIFGTIFERTLDEKKRGQLGAHYTSPADIRLIVEPVLMQPLRRAWAAVQSDAAPIHERYVSAPNAAQRQAAVLELVALRAGILEQVRNITVLDPACGSGNFLYISLRLLLDLEKEIIMHPLWAGLKPEETIKVHPTQLHGIEVNEIAHALASVVVWIGYLQWRYDNGFFEVSSPILAKMSGNIVHHDAILSYNAEDKPTEPEWAAVDVIVGNPPFLGDKKMRRELGDKYVTDVRHLYDGRVPGGADLVTYWFERARTQIELGSAKRAGLLATNSIRQGANRQALDRIKQTGDIFMAWSDREWVLEGAAVRVSIVGFDNAQESTRTLDGAFVSDINADLTADVDITLAKRLEENIGIGFIGDQKGGAFDISEDEARRLLTSKNTSGVNNSTVVRPFYIAKDLTDRWDNRWIIDFNDLSLEEASKYVEPIAFVEQQVKPSRLDSRDRASKEKWWLHQRSRPDLRKSIEGLKRFIATPRVAKHRIFVWLENNVIPDSRVLSIAREDDYFFGVLHSSLHELWSLKQASWHGIGNDPTYNAESCFETFPFPFVPGTEDFADPRIEAISAAAQALDQERDAWLNPPDPTPDLHERTLTNLYNALQAYRGAETTKGLKAAARAFAPRLDELHRALDAAVVAAYGWDTSILGDDEAILRALLALNQAKGG